jgi:hypothetical protein
MLKIGVLSFNKENSMGLLRDILEIENSHLKHKRNDRVILYDETEYIVMSSNLDHYRGYIFDQIIITTPEVFYYINHENKYFELQYFLRYSCVPDEFQIIYWNQVNK